MELDRALQAPLRLHLAFHTKHRDGQSVSDSGPRPTSLASCDARRQGTIVFHATERGDGSGLAAGLTRAEALKFVIKFDTGM